ncbi:uncharacterized protein LOC129609076 [Condylostylus longicornis]|uniref:uncharacterized protein LOC129609076 n=1 Tax=Condylostylus longicornis TaxID=2530218 RepID=UPI00244E3018|nr:uncharacterized protein LOC129609076 [Condylostylus longicornis]
MLGRTKLCLQLIRKLKNISICPRIRCFHDKREEDQIIRENPFSSSIKEKYIIYKDEDSVEIFDFEEEKNQDAIDLPEAHVIQRNEEGLNLKRGITGVYDIEDLVDILERENALNIFVCPVSKDLNYVDFMCIATGRSYRHMLAIVEYVRKIYKRKSGPNDILPKIEGKNCENWMAMDLGNIALHIFSEEAREKYDLETLWTLGPEFDDKEKHNYKEDYVDLYEQYTRYIDEDDNKNKTKKIET